MLGIKEGIAIDLDPIADAPRAWRGLARAADWLLQTPWQIVGRYPITRDAILHNLREIDVTRLRAGDVTGLGTSLSYRNESADALSLAEASVDVVLSTSFLEHVTDMHRVLAEMARVTKPGGFGVHSIDGNDHWSYGHPDIHPLDFLRQPSGSMVHDSNRLRLLEFPALFARHGFICQQCIPHQTIRITPALRASFAEPWRSMPTAILEVQTGVLVVRKE